MSSRQTTLGNEQNQLSFYHSSDLATEEETAQADVSISSDDEAADS